MLACSHAPAGPTATSSHGILPTSTARSPEASRYPASYGGASMTTSALPVRSMASPAFTSSFSTSEVWESWLAMDSCPIPGSNGSLSYTTATLLLPPRALHSTTSSSPTLLTTPTAVPCRYWGCACMRSSEETPPCHGKCILFQSDQPLGGEILAQRCKLISAAVARTAMNSIPPTAQTSAAARRCCCS